MTTTNDENVTDTLSTRLEHIRKYNRDYYHAHKQSQECPHCCKIFTSKSALVRHVRNGVKCRFIRNNLELEILRGALNGLGVPS